jgi:anti-sigma factor RsiW
MDPFFARNRLSAYLDGELSPGELRSVEAALQRDAGLRAELERLRAASALLKEGGRVEPPPGFADRVRARVDREPMRTGWSRWLHGRTAEAIALAAVAMLVVTVVGRRGEDPLLPAPPPAVPVPAAPAAPGSAVPAPTEPVAEAAVAIEEAPLGAQVPASAPPATGDGVLGNESVSRKRGPKEVQPAQGKTQSMVEKLPYEPEWEQRANQAQEPTAEEHTLYSPSPFRYQLAANDAAVLQRIAEIAKSLGGRLEDARGRPLAPYEMEQGDMRSVRIVVPSYNEAELSKRLRDLGSVTAVNGGNTDLVKPGSDVPVILDVNY